MAFVCQMPGEESCQVWTACYQFTNQVTPISVSLRNQPPTFFLRSCDIHNLRVYTTNTIQMSDEQSLSLVCRIKRQ